MPAFLPISLLFSALHFSLMGGLLVIQCWMASADTQQIQLHSLILHCPICFGHQAKYNNMDDANRIACRQEARTCLPFVWPLVFVAALLPLSARKAIGEPLVMSQTCLWQCVSETTPKQRKGTIAEQSVIFGTWTAVALLPDSPAYEGCKTTGSNEGNRLRGQVARFTSANSRCSVHVEAIQMEIDQVWEQGPEQDTRLIGADFRLLAASAVTLLSEALCTKEFTVFEDMCCRKVYEGLQRFIGSNARCDLPPRQIPTASAHFRAFNQQRAAEETRCKTVLRNLLLSLWGTSCDMPFLAFEELRDRFPGCYPHHACTHRSRLLIDFMFQ